jgi:hypothetical protein
MWPVRHCEKTPVALCVNGQHGVELLPTGALEQLTVVAMPSPKALQHMGRNKKQYG